MFSAISLPAHGIPAEKEVKERQKTYEVGADAIHSFMSARVSGVQDDTRKRISDVMAAIEAVDSAVDGFGQGFSLERFDRITAATVDFLRDGDESKLSTTIESADTRSKLRILRRHLVERDADLETYANVAKEVFAQNRIVHTTTDGKEFLHATEAEGAACEGLVSPLVDNISEPVKAEFRLLLGMLNTVDNVVDLRSDAKNGELALGPTGKLNFLARAAAKIPKEATQWLYASWKNRKAK